MLQTVLTAACVLALATIPAVAQDAPADDLLPDVLRMLDEGVQSNVIVDWLARTKGSVRRLGPDDMIALSKAGASEELVQALLERSAKPSAPPPPSKPSAPPPTPVDVDPPDAPKDGLAGIGITLHYRSQADYDEEERSKRWAMLAYLDGEPLIWSKSGSDKATRSLRISPGRHVVHVMRESHLDWKAGWRHESFVNVEPIEFTVEAGEGWHLSIEWVMKTLRFSGKGPLNWSLTRWNTQLAGATKAGELLDKWPRLCEDVEGNVPEGKTKTPGWIKRDLKGCVRWSDLWADVPGAPDRASVRKELEVDDYRPPLI